MSPTRAEQVVDALFNRSDYLVGVLAEGCPSERRSDRWHSAVKMRDMRRASVALINLATQIDTCTGEIDKDGICRQLDRFDVSDDNVAKMLGRSAIALYELSAW